MRKIVILFTLISTLVSAQDTIKLKEVVVSATRYEKSLNQTSDYIKLISKRDIEKLTLVSPGELLNNTTGINVENGTGKGYPKRSTINMNGFPANYNLSMLNGVKILTEHIHTGQNIDYIPIEMIDRIEIIEGAASAQYGSDAMGGVINIITKKPSDKPNGQITTWGGNNDNYLVSNYINTKVNKFGISSCMGWEKSNGIDITKPTNRKNYMGYSRQYILNNLMYNLSNTFTIHSMLNIFNNRMEWNDGVDKYSHLYMPSVGYNLRLKKLDQKFNVNYSHWEAQLSSELNQLIQPELNNKLIINNQQALFFGGDYRYMIFQREKVAKNHQQIIGAYITSDTKYRKGWYSTLSVRMDYPEEYKAVFSPKWSLMYRPDSSFFAIKTSIGRGFRYPTVQDKYELAFGHSGSALRFGNPDLKPEYSTTLTFAGEFIPFKHLSFQGKYYYNMIQDMIIPVLQGKWDVDTTKYVWMRQNIQNTVIHGYEISGIFTFNNVSFQLGYSNSIYSFNQNIRQLAYIPGSSLNSKITFEQKINDHLVVNVNFLYKQVWGRKAWNWKPAAGSSFDDASGLLTELKDYQLLSAGVRLKYKQIVGIFLNVDNMLKQELELLDDALMIIQPKIYYKAGLNFYF